MEMTLIGLCKVSRKKVFLSSLNQKLKFSPPAPTSPPLKDCISWRVNTYKNHDVTTVEIIIRIMEIIPICFACGSSDLKYFMPCHDPMVMKQSSGVMILIR